MRSRTTHISIPAFREEGDLDPFPEPVDLGLFQSPPSVRKATNGVEFLLELLFISIPAFREEGDFLPADPLVGVVISIPAFREEGDQHGADGRGRRSDFNPRLP